jgi:gliding motility-associated-like protein
LKSCIHYIVIIHILLFLQNGMTQEFINGSFESNTNTCKLDIKNAEFNASMPNVVALGTLERLDILQNNCGFGVAQDGKNFISLEIENGLTDAIALEVNEELQNTGSYFISFYARVDQQSVNEDYRFTLGYNISPTSYGNLLFINAKLTTQWKKYFIPFRLATNAKYITALIESAKKVKVYLDDFKFECPPTIDLGRDTTYCDFTPRTLTLPRYFQKYEWSTGQSTFSITANTPGLYAVTVSRGNCIYKDSINLILEDNGCKCNVYVPNVFKVGTGTNGTWKPLFTCDPAEYHLLIYDRWGNIALQSKDHEYNWTGEVNGKAIREGVYVFTLRYKGKEENAVERRYVGEILVMR